MKTAVINNNIYKVSNEIYDFYINSNLTDKEIEELCELIQKTYRPTMVADIMLRND